MSNLPAIKLLHERNIYETSKNEFLNLVKLDPVKFFELNDKLGKDISSKYLFLLIYHSINHKHRPGFSWIDMKSLLDKTGFSKNTLRNSLKKLIATKLISFLEIEKKPSKKKYKKSKKNLIIFFIDTKYKNCSKDIEDLKSLIKRFHENYRYVCLRTIRRIKFILTNIEFNSGQKIDMSKLGESFFESFKKLYSGNKDLPSSQKTVKLIKFIREIIGEKYIHGIENEKNTSGFLSKNEEKLFANSIKNLD